LKFTSLFSIDSYLPLTLFSSSSSSSSPAPCLTLCPMLPNPLRLAPADRPLLAFVTISSPGPCLKLCRFLASIAVLPGPEEVRHSPMNGVPFAGSLAFEGDVRDATSQSLGFVGEVCGRWFGDVGGRDSVLFVGCTASEIASTPASLT
jgi:hypothetical protein